VALFVMVEVMALIGVGVPNRELDAFANVVDIKLALVRLSKSSQTKARVASHSQAPSHS